MNTVAADSCVHIMSHEQIFWRKDQRDIVPASSCVNTGILDAPVQFSQKKVERHFISSEMRNVPLWDPVHSCLWNILSISHLDFAGTMKAITSHFYQNKLNRKKLSLIFKQHPNRTIKQQYTVLLFKSDTSHLCLLNFFLEGMPFSPAGPQVILREIAFGFIWVWECEAP